MVIGSELIVGVVTVDKHPYVAFSFSSDKHSYGNPSVYLFFTLLIPSLMPLQYVLKLVIFNS